MSFTQPDIPSPEPNEQKVELNTQNRPESALLEIRQWEVDELQKQRKYKAEALIQSGASLKEILQYFDNDYSALERLFLEKTGVELLGDPYEAMDHDIPITKTCSIVVPSYNKTEILANALRAIQASSFNAKYPQQLEVIVVDDASPDINEADVVTNLNLPDLTIKVIRHQTNHRVGGARYTGTLHATGDVVIITDPDVVYTPTTIEEFMKRHEILGDIVCFGLRNEINQADPRLSPEAVASGSLGQFEYDFHQDSRVAEDSMRESDFLKSAGHDKKLPINTGGDWSWRLASIAWGLSISAPRKALLTTMCGSDEGFIGWGCDDENMVSELIAEGLLIIPNTGGLALHQEHPSTWDASKSSINAQVLETNLNSSPKRQNIDSPKQYDAQVVYEQRNMRSEAKTPIGIEKGNIFKQAQVLMRLGLYEKAIKLFDKAEQEYGNEEWFQYDKAATLTGIGGAANVDSAIRLLQRSVELHPENVWMHIALADALATNRHYEKSMEIYRKAYQLDPGNWELRFMTGNPEEKANELHEATSKNYLQKGKGQYAVKNYVRIIALRGEEHAEWSVFDKGVALYQSGHIPEAITELERSAELLITKTWAFSKLGVVYESNNNNDRAISYYQKALEEDPNNWEANEGMKRLGLA